MAEKLVKYLIKSKHGLSVDILERNAKSSNSDAVAPDMLRYDGSVKCERYDEDHYLVIAKNCTEARWLTFGFVVLDLEVFEGVVRHNGYWLNHEYHCDCDKCNGGKCICNLKHFMSDETIVGVD